MHPEIVSQQRGVRMRRLFLLGAVTIALCGAALAQETTPPTPPPDDAFVFHTEARPGRRPLVNPYPQMALLLHKSGSVILCCSVRQDRTLNCRVGWESPQGSGFGESARYMWESQVILTQQSYATYHGGEIIIPYGFYQRTFTPPPPLPSPEMQRAFCSGNPTPS